MIYSDDLMDSIRSKKLTRKELKEVVWLSCVNIEQLARLCSMSTTSVSRFLNDNLNIRHETEIYDRIAYHIEGCNDITGTNIVTILTSGPEFKVIMDKLRLTQAMIEKNTGIYDLFTFIDGTGRLRLQNKLNLIQFINGFSLRHSLKPEYYLRPTDHWTKSASL